MPDGAIRTDDIHMAAFFVCRGETIAEFQWEGGGCWFVFTHCDRVVDLEDQYTHDEAMVNPRKYAIALLRVKREMRESNTSPAGGRRRG